MTGDHRYGRRRVRLLERHYVVMFRAPHNGEWQQCPTPYPWPELLRRLGHRDRSCRWFVCPGAVR
jgi:hypothetical protein